MVNDAEEYKRRWRKLSVEAKNALESYLYNTKSATDETQKMETD